MNNRPDYRRAARLAYQTLIALGSRALPVDMLAVFSRCRNTRVLSYTEAARMYGESVYTLVNKWPSDQAYTFQRLDNLTGQIRYMVYYNDDVCFSNRASRRWSLAHELAHILLGHGETAMPVYELEANCFAQHLLCPRPLLEALPRPDADMLCVAFGLSRAAAAIALRNNNKRSAYVDDDMRQGILNLYNLGSNPAWDDILNPFQRVAYDVRRRRSETCQGRL